MPNTMTNVAGYFFKRQLGAANLDPQSLKIIAELRARPLIAEIKHLLYQFQCLLKEADNLTDTQRDMANAIVKKIYAWHQLHSDYLYTYASIGAPCVINYLRELFRFDNFNLNMWVSDDEKLFVHFKSILDKLNMSIESAEYLSWQYVNLMNQRKFAQAIPLLKRAAAMPGEAAMEARTELLLLKLCASKLNLKNYDINQLVSILSYLGNELVESIIKSKNAYRSKIDKSDSDTIEYLADLDEVINLGFSLGLVEKNKILGITENITKATLNELDSQHQKQLESELLQAIDSCFTQRVFSQLDNYLNIYCTITDKSEKETQEFIKSHHRKIEQLAVDDESALLWLLKKTNKKSPAFAALEKATRVTTYEVLLSLAEAARGDEIEQYIDKLDPERDSRSAILFAQYAIRENDGKKALEYYKQSISPLPINHVQDALRCFRGYSCLLQDPLEANEIHLFMLERCITLIHCGELEEASHALLRFKHLFYKYQDTARMPAFTGYYGYLGSSQEYTTHLLQVAQEIQKAIQSNSEFLLSQHDVVQIAI